MGALGNRTRNSRHSQPATGIIGCRLETAVQVRTIEGLGSPEAEMLL